ncbi:MAG: hypothetical protein ACM3UR_02470, partial [Bacteroidota bacterium]
SLKPGDCTSLEYRDKFFEQNKQRLSPPESSTVSPLFVAKIFFLHVILIKILSFVNYFLKQCGIKFTFATKNPGPADRESVMQ